ncbi:MAG: AmmeMemoRadiSam system radical SAM enzyme [Deltaproteobacteria bacterium]|nr:AmmeMemoRadiSam system radical SAM enzyme [Deltaproteobacteria bacterium]MCL5276796.1 AmmeMemoRadiSam system radical SAM enzyme [Deltaproteobacteria bacterium]
MKIPAKYSVKGKDDRVRCVLCPYNCLIAEGCRGVCGIRGNEHGVLMAEAYNTVSAMHLDPIEKKPLYHFHPGSSILSVGTIGCSFNCMFCQNWELVEGQAPTHEITGERLYEYARQMDSIGMAYTYNEPFIWFEFVYDTAALFREKGMVNVLVTNGFVNPGPLEDIVPLIDAMNIDLKALDDDFYKRICKGRLDPVKHTIEYVLKKGVHVELTNLLVTGHNTSEEQIRRLVDYVASLGKDTVLHFSRYFPSYKLDAPATPMEVLEFAYGYARKKLNYVYVGNVIDSKTDSTYCPRCRGLLIERVGYTVRVAGLKGGRCGTCGERIGIRV